MRSDLRSSLRLCAVVLVVLAAGCAGGTAVRALPAAPDPARGTLQPGDIVKLDVWREEDFSGGFRVDSRGIVVLPRLGAYDVRTEDAASLRERLVRDFGRYLVNPSVQVTVLRPVRVLGAVHRPALYDLEPTSTLGDAIALAGGALPEGRGDRVLLVRAGVATLLDVGPGSPAGALPLRSGDELVVPLKSWVSRNAAALVTSVAAIIGVGITAVAAAN